MVCFASGLLAFLGPGDEESTSLSKESDCSLSSFVGRKSCSTCSRTMMFAVTWWVAWVLEDGAPLVRPDVFVLKTTKIVRRATNRSRAALTIIILCRAYLFCAASSPVSNDRKKSANKAFFATYPLVPGIIQERATSCLTSVNVLCLFCASPVCFFCVCLHTNIGVFLFCFFQLPFRAVPCHATLSVLTQYRTYSVFLMLACQMIIVQLCAESQDHFDIGDMAFDTAFEHDYAGQVRAVWALGSLLGTGSVSNLNRLSWPPTRLGILDLPRGEAVYS